MKRSKSSAINPLSPKRKWLVIFCRTQSILRNAASYVIRSILQTWSPTCSYASTLWRLAPKLSYGTKLPGTVNRDLRPHEPYIVKFFKMSTEEKVKEYPSV